MIQCGPVPTNKGEGIFTQNKSRSLMSHQQYLVYWAQKFPSDGSFIRGTVAGTLKNTC